MSAVLGCWITRLWKSCNMSRLLMVGLAWTIGGFVLHASGQLPAQGAEVAGNEAPRANSLRVDPKSPAEMAATIDTLIENELAAAGIVPTGLAKDQDFLRRVSLDLAGELPSPGELALFALDPSPKKREAAIDRLLATNKYTLNFSRYWRDVIFMPATEQRAQGVTNVFVDWMANELAANESWDKIATKLITATGHTGEDGSTALMFAHGGAADEVAAEVCRIFCGIQIQCANCHDHPTDIWKRDQFHELAAYFPRVQSRRATGDGNVRAFEIVSMNKGRPARAAFRDNPERLIARVDKNKDGKISKQEVEQSKVGGALGRVFELGLSVADANKDGMLDAEELKAIPEPDPKGRGSLEYYMPDLNDPSSKGKLVEPRFFVDGSRPVSGMEDVPRREELARKLATPANPWFAKAFVNRMWSELLGEGFVMPIDDLGPTRTAVYPVLFDELSQRFAASGYDIRWLLKSIALSKAYQRAVLQGDATPAALPFAAAKATRLRSDQIFNALIDVLGYEEPVVAQATRGGQGGPFRNNPRQQFRLLFGFDPSTPRDDLIGNVPQALFLMNSAVLKDALRGSGESRLHQILKKFPSNEPAVTELYLLTLSREPTAAEQAIAIEYVSNAKDRAEGFEDLLWSLLNSTEFLSRR